MFKRDASIPYVGIHDEVISVRRTYIPFGPSRYGNQGILAWLLDVPLEALRYRADEYQGPIGWFDVERDLVDLDWLALRVAQLQILIEVRCRHGGPECPVHDLDTRRILLSGADDDR